MYLNFFTNIVVVKRARNPGNIFICAIYVAYYLFDF